MELDQKSDPESSELPDIFDAEPVEPPVVLESRGGVKAKDMEQLKERLDDIEEGLYRTQQRLRVPGSEATVGETLRVLLTRKYDDPMDWMRQQARDTRNMGCSDCLLHFCRKTCAALLCNSFPWFLEVIYTTFLAVIVFIQRFFAIATATVILYLISQPLLYGSMYHEEFVHRAIGAVEFSEEVLNTGVQLSNVAVDVVRPVAPLWNFVFYWIRKISMLEVGRFVRRALFAAVVINKMYCLRRPVSRPLHSKRCSSS